MGAVAVHMGCLEEFFAWCIYVFVGGKRGDGMGEGRNMSRTGRTGDTGYGGGWWWMVVLLVGEEEQMQR